MNPWECSERNREESLWEQSLRWTTIEFGYDDLSLHTDLIATSTAPSLVGYLTMQLISAERIMTFSVEFEPARTVQHEEFGHGDGVTLADVTKSRDDWEICQR